MAVSKRTRYEVLRRDNHTCRYCGGTAPDVTLTIDHVVPTALGGGDDPPNLVAACKDCNAGKSSSSPDQALVDEVTEADLQFAAAIKRAAARRAKEDGAEREYAAAFDKAWSSWSTGLEHDKRPIGRPAGWFKSLASFYQAGLPQESMLRAVDIAMGTDRVSPHDTFRYFCGICWSRIKEIQDEARTLLDTPESEPRDVEDDDDLPSCDGDRTVYLWPHREGGYVLTGHCLSEIPPVAQGCLDAMPLELGESADEIGTFHWVMGGDVDDVARVLANSLNVAICTTTWGGSSTWGAGA